MNNRNTQERNEESFSSILDFSQESDIDSNNFPFIQTKLKPMRPRLRFLSWPQFFETILSYRHALTPFIIILCQFFIQAFGEMIVSMYGMYWTRSSVFHDINTKGSENLLLFLFLSLAAGGITLLSLQWFVHYTGKDEGIKILTENNKFNSESNNPNPQEESLTLNRSSSTNSGSNDTIRKRNSQLKNNSKNKTNSFNTKKKVSITESKKKVAFLYRWLVLQVNKFIHISITIFFIIIGLFSRLSLYWYQNDPAMRCIASSICFVSFLIVFMLALVYKGLGPKTKPSDDSLMYSIGLSNAFMVVIFWKTIGSTLDWSIHQKIAQFFHIFEVIIALIYCTLLLWVYYWRQYVRKNHMTTELGDRYYEAIIEQEKESMEWWKVHTLCVGLFGNFLLLFMTFGSPGVISRWVRGNYSASVLFQTLAFGGFTFLMSFKPKTVGYLRPVTLRLLNIIFGAICIALAFRSQFVNYHYAFGIQQSLVYIMHFMSPTFLLNIQLICHELLRSKEKVSITTISTGFFFATILYTFLIICSAFSVVSSYMEPRWLSKIFFGQHDITFSIMMIITILPMFFIRTNSLIFFNNGVDDIYRGDGRKNFKMRLSSFLFALIIGVSTISVLIWTTPVRYYLNTPQKITGHLHIGAYNVRSGFDRKGLLNFSEHFNTLKELNYDLVALIESDTCRIANGNSDFVRYAANHLEMYSYYGPKPTEGTLGVSFLSKFPIIRRRTKTLVTSAFGEKTALVVSKLYLSRKKNINFIIVHFGDANFVEHIEHLSQELRKITLNHSQNEGTILIADFIPKAIKTVDRRNRVLNIASEFGLHKIESNTGTNTYDENKHRTEIFFSSELIDKNDISSRYISHERLNDVSSLSTLIQSHTSRKNDVK